MKKIYNQPEIELVVIEEENISTASVVVGGKEFFGEGVTADTWEW